MTEVEKQESQKTVVAFITGLLIGGLLVWVFSSTPEGKQKPEEKKGTDTEEVAKKDDQKGAEDKKGENAEIKATGNGSITIADQAAGAKVDLGELNYPAKSGWVVVRDYKDGAATGVLGAAQYNTDAGVLPTSVELMRNTVSGNEYQVVFFTNEGTAEFKIGEDNPVDGTGATFKAN